MKRYDSAKDMWDALKENIGVTSCTLITKLDNYKDSQHSMKKHLCIMAVMIKNLRMSNHIMSDEEESKKS